MKIKNFKPYITGNEIKYIKDIIDKGYDMSGDGPYTKKVHNLLEKRYGVKKALLTTSGTTALEFAIRLLCLKPGDEVIVPSFTFSSTANAVLVSFGIKVVFAEIDSNTLNIDPNDIERKITNKTRAIIPVHYAGVACDMGRIMKIAKQHNLKVVEDAAQAVEAKYKDQYLGTIGDFGCLSFHDTKNISCGEGGALLINTGDKAIQELAEIIREKGTNRSKFFRGEVDKYTWVEIGSSYLPSDILAAYLLAQLEDVENITKKRLKIYRDYQLKLEFLKQMNGIRMPHIPAYAKHNAHIFYLILKNEKMRDYVMQYLRSKNISAPFHYVPLHSSPLGIRLGFKKDNFPVTEDLSKRLIRLPIYASMTHEEVNYVVKNLKKALTSFENQVPGVSVGIPAHNEQENIKKLLETIISQKGNFEIENIIVNCDGCTDETAEIVKKFDSSKVILINDGKHLGKSRRLNEIYELNKSDFLITLDADVLLKTNSEFLKLISLIQDDPTIDVVAGRISMSKPRKGLVAKMFYTNHKLWEKTVEHYKNGNNIHTSHGPAYIFRKSFIEKFRLPVGITCDQGFIYLASQPSGYALSIDSSILVVAPSSLNEMRIGASRMFTERQDLFAEFGEEILEEYKVPLIYRIQAIVKMFLQDPVYTLFAVIYNICIPFIQIKDTSQQNGLWTVIGSTKKRVTL